MASAEGRPSRDGLSVQTLIAAAIASAVAAIVTSTFWRGGTIITAAMTPVIVAIVKELVARPMQSELVRRPVERVRSVAPPATAVRRFERRERVPVPAGRRAPARERDVPPTGTAGDRTLATAPVRTYGRRRRLHVGAAVATGIVAFAVALVALTLPELIFGGSVASKGNTTFFGGGQAKTTNRTHESTTTTPNSTTPSQTKSSSSPSPTRTAPSEQGQSHTGPTQTAPQTQQSPSGGGGSAPPQSGSSPPSGGTTLPKK